MCASGQQAQHPGCVGGVDGLDQNLIVDYYDGVCAEHGVVGMLLGNGLGLLAGQAFGVLFGRFVRKRIFIDLGGVDFKGDVRVAEEFPAARGGGG
jgi:hypothetical protein